MTFPVKGKITVLGYADQTKLGKWGGTECFLSHENDLGPCLVVKTSSQGPGKGTFYDLRKISEVIGARRTSSGGVVLPPSAKDGKLTIVVERLNRKVNVMISAGDEEEKGKENVVGMAKLLCDGVFKVKKWKYLELEGNAGRKRRRGADGDDEIDHAAKRRREEILEKIQQEELEKEGGGGDDADSDDVDLRSLREDALKRAPRRGGNDRARIEEWIAGAAAERP